MPKELDMNKYRKLFVSESREFLRQMNDSMVQLEERPGDRELVDQMFRACHSIKGMAGMMNMKTVQDTAHALEDILGAVRDGRLEPTGRVAEAVYKGLDALDAMVLAVEGGQEISDATPLINELRASISAPGPSPAKKEKPQESKKKPAKEEEAVDDTLSLVVRLGRRCSLPSARAVVILKELSKAADILSNRPTDEEIDKEATFEELTVSLTPGDKIHEAIRRVASMTDVEEVRYGKTSEPQDRWQRLSRKASAVATPTDLAPAQTVRVGMDKLDDLLDNVGELVIGRSRLLEKATVRDDHELLEISSLIDKLTSDIQSRVLEIRMIPLDLVMSRFPRMVRDISKSQGKEVELVVEGGGIELDRTVVDMIAEPMMHLIRNCIDHGIETVEERTKAGKRSKGLIRIVASKQQDHVLIEVSDDGKGVDLERTKEAAVSKGVMTREQADAASGRELIDLLFRPGFSTKKEVTEVSGRGVGLDVVKRNVEDLGGKIMVSSSKGAGTTFSMWLPFTLAIIEAMLVSIADQTYAIPMSTIVESHRYLPSEVKTIRSREVVQLRGEVLPLISMRTFFGVEARPRSDAINTVVVQSRDRRATLEVDELLGHQQIVVKPLDQRLRKVKGVSGGTILGSGSIALILDVDSILGG
jgi:two-component system chemotaxis sensor kinase CheA